MISSAQVQRLATKIAIGRSEAFGRPVVWKGTTYTVAITGVKQSRAIESGGFELMPDATLRIATATYPAFTPALGDTITIDGYDVMVTALVPLPLSGEIKVELGKA